MACMDHCCVYRRCDWWIADNTRYGKPCPEHGEEWMRHYYDEELDDNWRKARGCNVVDDTEYADKKQP